MNTTDAPTMMTETELRREEEAGRAEEARLREEEAKRLPVDVGPSDKFPAGPAVVEEVPPAAPVPAATVPAAERKAAVLAAATEAEVRHALEVVKAGILAEATADELEEELRRRGLKV